MPLLLMRVTDASGTVGPGRIGPNRGISIFPEPPSDGPDLRDL